MCSCADYDVSTNIYPSLAEIGPEGGQLTTTFISNASWTADFEGCTVEPTSGIAGTWTVTVTVPSCALEMERTLKVKLQSKYGTDVSTRYFTITQHPAR